MLPVRPCALVAEVTYRCPLHCPFCSNPLELERYRRELDTACWRRVLQEAAALGVIHVFFTGGEPLVRRDLPELIEEVCRQGLYPFLSTGGTLVQPDLLQQLHGAGLRALQISLLDAQPAGNDGLAAAACFSQKHQAVCLARDAGFHVTLNVVLHRHNIDHMAEIIDLARHWQVDKLELAHVQYTGWAFRNRLQLLPSREQVEHAAALIASARQSTPLEIQYVLPDLFQQYPKACLQGWGRVFLTVAPDGRVLPCQSAREIPQLTFPSIHEHTLEEIWFDSAVFNRFRGTDWMPEPCQSCPRREQDFGGCRCQAFLITGDPAVTDPACHLSPWHALVDLEDTARTGESPPLVYRGTGRADPVLP